MMTSIEAVREGRSRGVEAFESVTKRLGATRSAAKDLSDHLSRFADLAAEDGAALLTTVVDAAETLGDAIEQWMDETQSAGLKQHGRQAARAISAIRSQCRQLGAIASITEITAGSASAELLVSYVGSLRHVAGALTAGAQDVERTLVMLERSSEEGFQRIADVKPALVDVIDSLRLCSDNEARVASDLLVDARQNAENAAGSAADEAKAAMARLIVGMQYSDEFNQRIEHVERLSEEAATAGIAALIGHQLQALAEDGASVLTTIEAALKDLRSVSDLSTSFIEQKGSAGATFALQAEEHALTSAISAHEKIAPALAAVDANRELVRERIGTTKESFTSLAANIEEIRLAAFNATLVSTRTGQSRGPLSVLADAVREGVSEASENLQSCDTALHAIATAHESKALVCIMDAARDFNRRVEACRAACATADRSLSEIDAIRGDVETAADRVRTEIAAASAAMADVVQTLDSLRSAGQHLSETNSKGPPDQEALARAWESYTMPRERQVHEAVFGPMEAGADADVAADGMEFF
jgi:hypothetical protein